MITDGGCAGVERAGVGTDHPLAQVGILQPLILEIMLDELCHRPIEQHPARFFILAQASVQLFRGGSVANPKVTIAGGPQSIPQTPDHCRHRHPAIHIAGSKAPDLSLARVIVIPQLNAAAIEKRHKEAIRSGRPMKPSFHQSQLVHHQRMQQLLQDKRTATSAPQGKAPRWYRRPPLAARLSSTRTRLPARAR